MEFNPAAERIFGYSRAEVLGRSIGDLIVPQRHRAAHSAGMERYLATRIAHVIGRRVRTHALRRDGSEFPVEPTIAEVIEGG